MFFVLKCFTQYVSLQFSTFCLNTHLSNALGMILSQFMEEKANSLFQKISIKNYAGKKIYNSTKFNQPAACISNTTDNYSLS